MISSSALRTSAADQLSLAEDALVRAVAGQDPVVFVNEALRIVGDLAFADRLGECDPTNINGVCSLLREVKPILAKAVADKINPVDLTAAFDAAIILMGADASKSRRCLLAVGILKSDLTGMILREELVRVNDDASTRLN